MNYKTGRDLVFYVIGYIAVGVIYYMNSYDVMIAALFIVYYFVYCTISSRSEGEAINEISAIKEAIMADVTKV